jgi:hypothetical protein
MRVGLTQQQEVAPQQAAAAIAAGAKILYSLSNQLDLSFLLQMFAIASP